MGYDKEKDEILWSGEANITDPFGDRATKMRFVVNVVRYDGGKPKVDIKRLSYGARQRGEYGKLGRLSLYELEKLLPVINEAWDFLRKI